MQTEELSYEEDTEILMHDVIDIINEYRVTKDETLKPDRITLEILRSTINVPEDFRTIQDAIDASVDGDIIEVQTGIYIENLDINGKNLTLKGESNASTIIIMITKDFQLTLEIVAALVVYEPQHKQVEESYLPV